MQGFWRVNASTKILTILILTSVSGCGKLPAGLSSLLGESDAPVSSGTEGKPLVIRGATPLILARNSEGRWEESAKYSSGRDASSSISAAHLPADPARISWPFDLIDLGGVSLTALTDRDLWSCGDSGRERCHQVIVQASAALMFSDGPEERDIAGSYFLYWAPGWQETQPKSANWAQVVLEYSIPTGLEVFSIDTLESSPSFALAMPYVPSLTREDVERASVLVGVAYGLRL